MRSVTAIIEEGFALLRDGRPKESIAVLDKVIGLPGGADLNALAGYATALALEERHGLSAYLLEQILERCETYSPIWENLAIAYKNLGRIEEAKDAFAKAIELSPERASIWANLCSCYINLGQPDKVIEYATKAGALDPNDPHAHNHLALGLLEAGRWAEAWPHYEHRWLLPERQKDRRPYKAPKWDGSPIGTLAIHGEQGVGDEIFFMANFAEAQQRAERIVIECQPRLIPLFERSFKVPCYGTHDEMIQAEGEPDAYIAMGSLPGLLPPPDGRSYLTRRVLTQPGRIGIAWKGGTARTNKAERSLKLEELRPILDIPGCEFVSVQYGGAEVSREAKAAGLDVVECDFDGLTDLVASCELVISVCQTAVHQAGAMGVECWVLTPRKCGWRYTGEAMSWYRSVRLFRQGSEQEWGPVVWRIADQLHRRCVADAAE